MIKNSYYHVTLIDSIEWENVASCLYQTENQKLSRDEWINKEQLIMSKRIKLIVEAGLNELRCDNWLFRLKIEDAEKKQFNLRIMFIPIDFVFHIENRIVFQSQTHEKNVEWKKLHRLLATYMDNEEYEKCQLIKNRMLEIVDELD